MKMRDWKRHYSSFCIPLILINYKKSKFRIRSNPAGFSIKFSSKNKSKFLKVLERFHLQLSDEAVCQLVVRLIESSLSAKMPLIVDFVHNVRQYMSN